MVDGTSVGSIAATVTLQNGIPAVLPSIAGSLMQLQVNVQNTAQQAANSFSLIPQAAAYSIARAGAILTTAITLPLLLLAKTSTSTYESYAQSMLKVQAATGEAADKFEDFSNWALKAGDSAGYTATETAKAAVTAAQMGLSLYQVQQDLPVAMNMARAGKVDDIDTSIKLLTSLLTTFKLTNDQAAHVGDVLVYIINHTRLEMNDLVQTMKYAAPTAKNLGMSFDELAAIIKVVSERGITASMAGTGLTEAWQRLLNPTQKAIDILTKYGLTADMVNPKLHTTIDIINTLQKTGIAYNPADVNTLFGMRGARTMTPLIQAGGSEIQSTMEQLQNSTGYAQQVAAVVNSGFPEAIRKVNAELTRLKITLGDIIKDMLIPLMNHLDNLIERFEALPRSTQKSYVQFAAVLAILGPSVLLYGKLAQVINGVGPAIKLVSTGASVFGDILAGVGNVILFVANAFSNVFLNKILLSDSAIGSVTATMDGLVAALGSIFTVSNLVIVIIAAVGLILLDVARKTGILDGAFRLLKATVRIVFDSIIIAIKDCMKFVDKFSDAIINFGVKLEEKYPKLKAFWDNITESSDKAVQSAENYADALDKQAFGNNPKDLNYEALQQNQKDLLNNPFNENMKSMLKGSVYNPVSDEELQQQNEAIAKAEQELNERLKYSIDQYGDLVKTEVQTIDGLTESEVEDYAKMAYAAGESASFRIKADGSVTASIEKVTKLIETEQGKYQDAVKAAEAAGKKFTYNFSTDSMGQQTREAQNAITTYENGVKTTLNNTTTEVINRYGQVIDEIKNVVKTTDDGMTQIVTNSSSEFQDKFNRVAETDRDAMGQTTRTLHDTQTRLVNGIKTTTDIATTNVINAFGRVIDTVKEVTKTIDDGITQTVSKTATELSNVLNSETDTVKDASGNLTTTVTNTQTSLVNGVKTIIETITNTTKNALGQVVAYTKDVQKTVDDGINKTVSKTQEATSNQTTHDIQNTIDAFGNLQQVTTTTQTNIKNGITDITKTVTTDLYDANRSLISSVQDVTDTLDTGVDKYTTSYKNLGAAIAEELPTSFTDAFGQVISFSGKTVVTDSNGNLLPSGSTKGAASGNIPTPTALSSAVSKTGLASIPPTISTVGASAASLSSSFTDINNFSFNNLITNFSKMSTSLRSMVSYSQQLANNMDKVAKSASKIGSMGTSSKDAATLRKFRGACSG